MTNEEGKIELLIQKYSKYIDDFQEPGSLDTNPEIIKLRHQILFVHSQIEYLLQFLVVTGLTEDSESTTSIALTMYKIGPFLEYLDYHKLCDACMKTNLITETQYKKLMSVNNHRVNFAHPNENAHKKKIDSYLNNVTHLGVLKELASGLVTMVEIFDNFEKRKNKFKTKEK